MKRARFYRAPDADAPEEVLDYLWSRGCNRVELHLGPDGRVRGSGLWIEDFGEEEPIDSALSVSTTAGAGQ